MTPALAKSQRRNLLPSAAANCMCASPHERRAKDARAFLHERFRPEPGKGFKALLASAPLEGVDLARERDYGRDVSL